MDHPNELLVRPTPADAAHAAAAIAVRALNDAIDERGTATFAVSGGTTAASLFSALATRRAEVPWDRVAIVQVDERMAPDGHPDRNAVTLAEHLVGPLRLTGRQMLLVDADAQDPVAAAADYDHRVAALTAGLGGRLDVIHLGLGDDGHTASLVPGDPALDAARSLAASTGIYKGRVRVTLTYEALDAARCLIWLATGVAKAPVLPLLLAGDPSIPAGRVRPSGPSTVVVDALAASEVGA